MNFTSHSLCDYHLAKFEGRDTWNSWTTYSGIMSFLGHLYNCPFFFVPFFCKEVTIFSNLSFIAKTTETGKSYERENQEGFFGPERKLLIGWGTFSKIIRGLFFFSLPVLQLRRTIYFSHSMKLNSVVAWRVPDSLHIQPMLENTV